MSIRSLSFILILIIAGLKCLPELEFIDPVPSQIKRTEEVSFNNTTTFHSEKENFNKELFDDRHYVKDFFLSSEGNHTRFVIQLNELSNHETHILENPDRVYIDLFNTIIIPSSQCQQIDGSSVVRVRTGQFDPTTARIVLDMNEKMAYTIQTDSVRNEIHLDFSGGATGAERLYVSTKNIEETESLNRGQHIRQHDHSMTRTLAQELGLKIKTIVIDPGHGGKDPGAISPGGLNEKDVTLDIALKLKYLLLQDGAFNVLLTRESDIFIPLEERTAFANQNGGDLFISIHVNSHTLSDRNGIETFFLSLAEDEDSRLVAANENKTATTHYSNLEELLAHIMKNSKIEESRNFAEMIQDHLVSKTRQPDRGVKKAGFYVLIGANMPSILTEVGFLSNLSDERLLVHEHYRKMIALALFQAVKAYSQNMLALSEL